MNLQGKIVKYHVPEENQSWNNQQKTCPAIIVTDWAPDEEVENKAVNLQVLIDGIGTCWESSVCHKSQQSDDPNNKSWELYE